MASYWSINRRIRRNVSQTMSACNEESACGLHSQTPAISPKHAKMSEAVGDQAEDRECQLSVSNTSYLRDEFQKSGCCPNFIVNGSDNVESNDEPDEVIHSDSDVSDRDWADMLKNLDSKEYFDALSDISHGDADNDLDD